MSRSCSADMPAAGSVGAREVFVLTAEAPAPLDTKRWVWSSWSLFRSTQPLSPRHLGSVVRHHCRTTPRVRRTTTVSSRHLEVSYGGPHTFL